MRRQENQKFKCEKCDISKGARYKNNPKREIHHYQNEKKNANLYTLGVESLTSAPGEARYSNEFTKKRSRNLDKAVHFQRGLRAILYKFEFAKYKKKNLNRLYTCSAFSRPVKRSQNQVLDLDTVTVKKVPIYT
jgi:hypothetical protein